ncbi:MAG: hypothetical protein J5742_04115 [Alphaproteobacteria bacterium]|nr:hypothetical protein [Alphaproteobacteria bacterium]
MKGIYFASLVSAMFLCAPRVAGAYGFIKGVVPFPTVAPSTNNSGGWLDATMFPKDINDVSFTDRMIIKAKGYEPFKDMDVYRGIVVEGEEHFIERQLALMAIQRDQDEQTMSTQDYCNLYPLDEDKCDPDDETVSSVVGIGDAKPNKPISMPAPTLPIQRPPSSNIVSPVFTGKTIGGGPVIVGNKTHDGSCYPAAKSDVFSNQVLTTGQYESLAPAFEKALITVFRKEGKCGTIKNDPCGYTCYGIGSKCMNIDVSKITRADAENIYYERFWAKYNFKQLPDVVAGDLFLASMASGPCTAIQQFRGMLGLDKNCKIDDTVVSAVENYNGDIHNDWLDVRQKFLVDVAARKYQNSVLKGWMNAIKLKRENGCHVVPAEPLYRN